MIAVPEFLVPRRLGEAQRRASDVAPVMRREVRIASAPGSDPGASRLLELIALRAVFGQDEANHGTTRYRVDNDGLVRVPREAVSFLTGKGGFAVAKTTAATVLASEEASPLLTAAARAEKADMVKLRHEDAAGCSYRGCEYSADENGDVLVPAEAVRDLLAHGFVPALRGAAPVLRCSQAVQSASFTKG